MQYLLPNGEDDKVNNEVYRFFHDFYALSCASVSTFYMEPVVQGFPGKTRVTLSAVAGDFGDMLITAVISGLLKKWKYRQIGQIVTICPVTPAKKSKSRAEVNT